MNIQEAKEIAKLCDGHSINHWCTDCDRVDMAKSFLEGWNQAVAECAEIVDGQHHHQSETGGEEELTTARNLILKLSEGDTKGEGK